MSVRLFFALSVECVTKNTLCTRAHTHVHARTHAHTSHTYRWNVYMLVTVLAGMKKGQGKHGNVLEKRFNPYLYTCAYTHARTHTHTHTCARMYACMCVCMCVCV